MIFKDRLAAAGKIKVVFCFYSLVEGVDKAYLTKVTAQIPSENAKYLSPLPKTKRVFEDCVSRALKVLLMDL